VQVQAPGRDPARRRAPVAQEAVIVRACADLPELHHEGWTSRRRFLCTRAMLEGSSDGIT